MSIKIKSTIAAALLAGSGPGMNASAQAHISDGAAVGVGILGLSVGPAIASGHHHRYYDGGYYAPPFPPPVSVYNAPLAYAYDYVQYCRVFNRPG